MPTDENRTAPPIYIYIYLFIYLRFNGIERALKKKMMEETKSKRLRELERHR